MKILRTFAAVAVVLAGAGAAQALGRNDFLDLLVTQFTSAKATLADPNQATSVDNALATLQTAPGDGEFDALAPDLKVAAKAVKALGPALADVNVAAAVNGFLPGAFANVIGRGAQAYNAAPGNLSPIARFKLVQKIAKIQTGLEKASNDSKLSPDKKLSKFSGAAKKYDAIYKKFS